MWVGRNVLETGVSISSRTVTAVERRPFPVLIHAELVELLTPLQYKRRNQKEEKKNYAKIFLFVGFLFYLQISTVVHILLPFAALSESLLHTVNGLGLTSQPLVAYTWQAVDFVEGAQLLVATQ